MTAPVLVMWVCEICEAHNGPTLTECRDLAAHPAPIGSMIRAQQTVPSAFGDVLREMKADLPLLYATLAAARQAGWTLQALGSPLGLTRERIRQVVMLATEHGDVPEIPRPPHRPPPPRRPQRPQLEPTAEVADKLREMHAIARTVTGGRPADHPARAVSVEFTALLQTLVDQGVTEYRLAKVLGINHNAIYGRLARHGYREPQPSDLGSRYTGQQSRYTRRRSKGGVR